MQSAEPTTHHIPSTDYGFTKCTVTPIFRSCHRLQPAFATTSTTLAGALDEDVLLLDEIGDDVSLNFLTLVHLIVAQRYRVIVLLRDNDNLMLAGLQHVRYHQLREERRMVFGQRVKNIRGRYCNKLFCPQNSTILSFLRLQKLIAK